MKNQDRILRYIEVLLDKAVKNPRGYAPSAEALENLFIVLENLREFMLSDESEPEGSSMGYGQFLVQQGHDAGGFLADFDQADEDSKFDAISSFWAEFMQSPYRVQSK